MLEQFIKSILAYFISIEPMNAYVQDMPQGVQYPCYFLNKCDVKTNTINSYYFMNTVTLYIRIFDKDEVQLKNKVFNLIGTIFENQRKIPILNSDGSESNRYIRIEDIESIDIPVDEVDVSCIEIVFNFDTTHNITSQQFQLLGRLHINIEQEEN
jgi:hypothetical protein